MAFSTRPPRLDALPPLGLPGFARPSAAPPPNSTDSSGPRASGVQAPTVNNKQREGFQNPKVVKGKLVVVDTGYTYRFMFNPTETNRTSGWDWASHQIPGASHPVISGGHGGQRSISFVLYLDADRGRAHARRGQDLGETSLDLSKEISFLRSLTFPTGRVSREAAIRDGGAERVPGRVILSIGKYLSGVTCVATKADERIIAFTPQLAPMRAEISMSFLEVLDRPLLASDVFSDVVMDFDGSFTSGNEGVG